jgi:hypothetical protein
LCSAGAVESAIGKRARDLVGQRQLFRDVGAIEAESRADKQISLHRPSPCFSVRAMAARAIIE